MPEDNARLVDKKNYTTLRCPLFAPTRAVFSTITAPRIVLGLAAVIWMRTQTRLRLGIVMRPVGMQRGVWRFHHQKASTLEASRKMSGGEAGHHLPRYFERALAIEQQSVGKGLFEFLSSGGAKVGV